MRLVLFLVAATLVAQVDKTWAQRAMPTVRIGIEAPAGTNAHYFVTKQSRLISKARHQHRADLFPGGTVGMQSLFAGDIQFATSDGVAGLIGEFARRQSLFCRRHDQYLSLHYPVEPEIRAPQDLRGKKIVISRYGSSSDTAVRAAVEKYDLKPDKDVIILQGGGQTERFAALSAGAVDAAIVSPPLNLAGKKWDLTRSSICRSLACPMPISRLSRPKIISTVIPTCAAYAARALRRFGGVERSGKKDDGAQSSCQISAARSGKTKGPDGRNLSLLQ